MTVLYNEIEPYACDWIDRLIAEGHIAHGRVDRRSIAELRSCDVRGLRQLHLFAGLGLWSLAFRLAGLADDAQAWSGSCPCQPFSQAGKRKGERDERHLWPVMRALIEIHRPPVVFGEQVASSDGRDWLSRVFADLEELGYAVAASDLCAAGVAAPHQRQRLYWGAARLGDPNLPRLEGRGVSGGGRADERALGPGSRALRSHPALPDTDSRRQPEHAQRDGGPVGGSGTPSFRYDTLRLGLDGGRWGDDWVRCQDGAFRRVEPTIPLVADARSLRQRVGRLRAYGNAINPYVAAEFVAAFLEAVTDDGERQWMSAFESGFTSIAS